MSRQEFIRELEYLLQDLPEEGKEDALQYYRDYLDEAGPEQEERVLNEFGSPERVAAIIRAGLTGELEDGGEFTDTGYVDSRFRDPGRQVARREAEETGHGPEPDREEGGGPGGENVRSGRSGESSRDGESSRGETNNQAQKSAWEGGYAQGPDPRAYRRKHSGTQVFLIVVILLVTSPVWLGIGTALLGIAGGIIAVFVAILLCLLTLMIAAPVAGIALIAVGLMGLAVSPAGALAAIGFGGMGVGAGLLLLSLFLWLCCTAVPCLLRGIGGCFRRLWKGRGRA